jgi:hypothetical protein
MAAGVTTKLWSLMDMARVIEDWEARHAANLGDRLVGCEGNAHMKIIGILVAITCLSIGDAAQAACPSSADAYQPQRDARARDTTPEQLANMQIGGLLARAAAGFKTAVEELACRGWSQSQIDEAVRRVVARQTSPLHSD